MMDATLMTEVTPMTIPRIVRAERILWERMVLAAARRFSWSSKRVIGSSKTRSHECERCTQECVRHVLKSFGPQGHYGVQPGRADRGVDSEEEADHRT